MVKWPKLYRKVKMKHGPQTTQAGFKLHVTSQWLSQSLNNEIEMDKLENLLYKIYSNRKLEVKQISD